jgi:hypothetical protein
MKNETGSPSCEVPPRVKNGVRNDADHPNTSLKSEAFLYRTRKKERDKEKKKGNLNGTDDFMTQLCAKARTQSNL